MPQTFTVTTPIFGPTSRKDADEHTRKLESAVREGFLPLKRSARPATYETEFSALENKVGKVRAEEIFTAEKKRTGKSYVTLEERFRLLKAEDAQAASRGNKCPSCGGRLSSVGCKTCAANVAPKPAPTLAAPMHKLDKQAEDDARLYRQFKAADKLIAPHLYERHRAAILRHRARISRPGVIAI